MGEEEDQERERRIWGDGALNTSSPRRGPKNNLHTTVLAIQQVQMENQANQVREHQDRLHVKELENIELRAMKRNAEEVDEPIAFTKKLRFTKDEDGAWTNINKSAEWSDHTAETGTLGSKTLEGRQTQSSSA